MPESVILLVDNLDAESTEVVKSRAALSSSNPQLLSTFGDLTSEARLRNRAQSVNF
jgi:hypothetical protein